MLHGAAITVRLVANTLSRSLRAGSCHKTEARTSMDPNSGGVLNEIDVTRHTIVRKDDKKALDYFRNCNLVNGWTTTDPRDLGKRYVAVWKLLLFQSAACLANFEKAFAARYVVCA